MNNALLLNKLSVLPKNLQAEVADFIDFLLAKSNKPKLTSTTIPKFGSAKGVFKMKANFEEPLEDFKEYMN